MTRLDNQTLNNFIQLNNLNQLPLSSVWAVSFAITVAKWRMKHDTRKQLSLLSAQQLADIALKKIKPKRKAKSRFGWIKRRTPSCPSV